MRSLLRLPAALVYVLLVLSQRGPLARACAILAATLAVVSLSAALVVLLR